jgi:hypothetical protein
LRPFQAESHIFEARGRAFQVGAEHTIPPRKDFAQVGVLFAHLFGVVDTMHPRSDDNHPNQPLHPNGQVRIGV